MGKNIIVEGQVKFIESYGKNVLLTASAGSGKTHTMINKLLDIVTNSDPTIRCDISNIMVVTFTKNAAGEMKQRLQKVFAEDKDIDPDMLDRVASSDIGTVHSIGHKLITKYFFASDLDQSVAVLEPSEGEYLLATSIDRVIRDYNKSDDKEYQFLYQYFEKKRSNKNLVDVIKRLYSYLETKVDPKQFLSDMIDDFVVPYENNKACAFVLQNIKDRVAIYAAMFQDLYNECTVAQFVDGMKVTNELLGICDNIYKCQDMPTLKKVLDNAKIPDKIPKKIETAETVDINSEIESVKDNFKTDITKKFKEYVVSKEQFDDCLDDYISIIKKLIEVVDKVSDAYQKAKHDRNAIDFTDIERMTVKLLQNPDIKKEIQDTYKYVFVDEYQDFTDMQEYIVTNISRGNNLYMIGDVKQSIYGFRNCTPNIYLTKMNKYKDNIGGSLCSIRHNFRSHKGILEFVNSIFDKVMTAQNTGITYYQENDLIGGTELQESKSCEISLDIINTKKDIDDDTTPTDDAEKYTSVQEECRLVCEKIQGCIGKEYLDIKTGLPKTISYRDIAILLRNRNHIDELYDMLNEYNIPVSLDYKTDIFADYSVCMLYDILKVVANDYDDIALTTYLLSPIVQMTNDELAQISQFDDSKYFYQKVKNYNINDDILYKIQRAYWTLDSFREYLMSNSVSDLIKYIVETYDIENLCNTLSDGAIRFNNVCRFIDLVKSGDDNNIYKTLSYLQILEGGDEIETTITTSSDAVQVFTMHGSKGLEWPVVIVPFLSSMKKNDSTEKIIITDEFGIGMKYRKRSNMTISNTIFFTASKLQKNIMEYGEGIRLLYVTLTRAKHFLYLIGSCDVDNIYKNVTKPTYQYTNYLNMILSSFDKKVLKNISNHNNDHIQYPSADFLINVHDCDTVKEAKVQENIEGVVDENAVDEIVRFQNFVYPYSEDSKITIKNSVTSILKESGDYENILYVPKTFDIANGQSDRAPANEIGTAYHKIMQYAVENRDVDILTIIDILQGKGIIDSKICKNLDVKNIEKTRANILDLVGDSKVMCEAQFMCKARHCDVVQGSMSDAKILVQGVVDLLILSPNGAIIVDYKTNKRSCDQIKKMYQVQLDLYAKAVQDGLRVNVYKKYIYSTYNSKLIEL